MTFWLQVDFTQWLCVVISFAQAVLALFLFGIWAKILIASKFNVCYLAGTFGTVQSGLTTRKRCEYVILVQSADLKIGSTFALPCCATMLAGDLVVFLASQTLQTNAIYVLMIVLLDWIIRQLVMGWSFGKTWLYRNRFFWAIADGWHEQGAINQRETVVDHQFALAGNTRKLFDVQRAKMRQDKASDFIVSKWSLKKV